MYIMYIGLGWVCFYGISTIEGYLMLDPLYTYLLNIYDLVRLNCGLFNAKSSLYIYIKDIWFGLICFYGTSTIVAYLIAKPSLYIYIKYI